MKYMEKTNLQIVEAKKFLLILYLYQLETYQNEGQFGYLRKNKIDVRFDPVS